MDDVDVELWEYNAVIAKLQYFVQYDGTPKALSTLVRQASISPFLNFQMDFSNVVPTSLDSDTFNVTQFGCPDPKPPKLYSVNGYALDATTGYAIAGRFGYARHLSAMLLFKRRCNVPPSTRVRCAQFMFAVSACHGT